MKIQYVFCLFLMFLVFDEAWAQTELQQYLMAVEENNYSLKTARQQSEMQKQAARTSILPADPQIGFGYLKGDGGSYAREIEVSQSFEFPTVYVQQSKLSKQQQKMSETQYALSKQQLILKATKGYYRYIFLRKKHELTDQQKESTLKLGEAVNYRFKIGDATIVQQQKVELARTSAENFCRLVSSEIEQQESRLRLFAPNSKLKFQADEYPLHSTLPLDSLILIYKSSPQMRINEQGLEQAKTRVKISKSKWLPNLTLGYAQEKTASENLSGIRAGISIPLWGNSRTVKRAKATLAFRDARLMEQQKSLELQIKQLYIQQEILEQSIKDMKTALKRNNVPDFLLKALKEGEMSLIDYLNEIGFYYEKELELLEMEFNYQLTKITLLQVTLGN